MSAARILRHARRRAGMTQRALAHAAGVGQPTIARIERGTVEPRFETLSRLLHAAGADLELVERAGIGIDRSLIKASLELTAEERIVRAAEAARSLARLLGEVKDARTRG